AVNHAVPPDIEPAERRTHELLANVPPRALPLGFRDAVMRQVAGGGRMTWEWLIAAALALPSLAFLAHQLSTHGDEFSAALNNVIATQRGLPVALQPIVPVQRGLTDTARDAAGYLLTLLATSAALVLARDQVVGTYRASLGGWRSQLRVLLSGLAVIGVGASAAAPSWIAFLGSIAGLRNAGLVGVPAALQVGLAVFSDGLALVGLETVVGFDAHSQRR